MKDEKSMYKLVCSSRFDSMEIKLEAQREDIGAIKRKVFNGYENRFNDMDKKLEEFKNDNSQAHAELRRTIDSMNKFIRSALLSMIGLLLTFLLGLGVDFIITRATAHKSLKNERVIEKDISDEINTAQR